jgi:alanyl-tRNA synthetase
MERQKAEARRIGRARATRRRKPIWFEIKDRVGATDFLGYDTETAEGVIQASGSRRQAGRSSHAGDQVDVVVNQTPFYGESGGQMGDQGTISGEGYRLEVSDTQKRGEGLFVHRAKVVSEGDRERAPWRSLRSIIRAGRRSAPIIRPRIFCMRRLREVLGTHVAQKGSLVAPERLRFDISHPKPMSAEELGRGRSHGQRDHSAEQPGHNPADGGR